MKATTTTDGIDFLFYLYSFDGIYLMVVVGLLSCLFASSSMCVQKYNNSKNSFGFLFFLILTVVFVVVVVEVTLEMK